MIVRCKSLCWCLEASRPNFSTEGIVLLWEELVVDDGMAGWEGTFLDRSV